MLAEIWQKYIQDWHEGNSPRKHETADGPVDDGVPAPPPSALWKTMVTFFSPRVQAGMCGRYVGLHKHIRLKITHKTGEFADLPQSQWLEVEGAMRNANHYQKFQDETNLRYSKHNHELVWNQHIGKTIGANDEGIVRCCTYQKWWHSRVRLGDLHNPSSSSSSHLYRTGAGLDLPQVPRRTSAPLR